LVETQVEPESFIIWHTSMNMT